MKVAIINGSGTSGKDTVVELTRTYFLDKNEVVNLSTIDKIKDIARQLGWNCEKDEKGRQFLADLKTAWTNYNNGANQETLNNILRLNIDEFSAPKEFIVFVHCREPEAIQWFVEKLKVRNIKVCTVFVERQGIVEFFNAADQGVNKYNYDITILNNGTLEELEKICKDFADLIINWNIEKRILV